MVATGALVTAQVLGGDGWLGFMGNEFGHPEWMDFPRRASRCVLLVTSCAAKQRVMQGLFPSHSNGAASCSQQHIRVGNGSFVELVNDILFTWI